MASRPRVAIQMVLPFVHFVAIGASKPHPMIMLSICMFLEVFRIAESSRTSLALVLSLFAGVV